jgi:UDP-N-acetylglucosamine:LPS N-acetylglucosamine transferase
MINESDLTAKGMARTIMKFMDNRPALEEMGTRAKKMGRRDSAKEIADQLLDLIGVMNPTQVLGK